MTETDTPTSPHTVRVGQIYEECADTFNERRRIRVIHPPNPTTGTYGFGKAYVATVTESGALIRHRWIKASNLHANPDRRTGYRLISVPSSGVPR